MFFAYDVMGNTKMRKKKVSNTVDKIVFIIQPLKLVTYIFTLVHKSSLDPLGFMNIGYSNACRATM